MLHLTQMDTRPAPFPAEMSMLLINVMLTFLWAIAAQDCATAGHSCSSGLPTPSNLPKKRAHEPLQIQHEPSALSPFLSILAEPLHPANRLRSTCHSADAIAPFDSKTRKTGNAQAPLECGVLAPFCARSNIKHLLSADC